jgi:hypothetical protein
MRSPEILTYSMEQSPSWEANQSLQLVKKFPAFLWNPKVPTFGNRGEFCRIVTAYCFYSKWFIQLILFAYQSFNLPLCWFCWWKEVKYISEMEACRMICRSYGMQLVSFNWYLHLRVTNARPLRTHRASKPNDLMHITRAWMLISWLSQTWSNSTCNTRRDAAKSLDLLQ